MNKEFIAKLANIQQALKAPKGQTNTFGKYKYRNCEDILEAVKPLLGEIMLTLTDDIKEVGQRVYVVATATLTNGESSHSVTAMAREALTKKGMDESQITGAASSYARKYALNGLFCIDDTKDADHGDNTAPKKSGFKLSKEINLILENINNNNKEWVNKEWKGIIAKNWSQLDGATIDQLNKMIGG